MSKVLEAKVEAEQRKKVLLQMHKEIKNYNIKKKNMVI